jgi:hypothetical protein
LNALARIAEPLAEPPGEADPERIHAWWRTHSVLMIHSGGDSRRLPQFSATGKLFGLLPVRAAGGGVSTVFDETLALSTSWLDRMDAGLVIGSGDVLLVFDPDGLDWRRPGVNGVALWQPAAVGSQHGVMLWTGWRRLLLPSANQRGRNAAAGGLSSDGRWPLTPDCFLRFRYRCPADRKQPVRLRWRARSISIRNSPALTKQWHGSRAPRIDSHCQGAFEGGFPL